MAEKVKHIYLGAESMLTALGDSHSTIESVEAGKSGLEYCDSYGVYAGLMDDSLELAAKLDGYTRFESVLINNIDRVLNSSGLSLKDRSVQLIISTTKGNVDLLQDSVPDIAPEAFLYNSAESVSSYFRSANRPVVISNACISGLSAFNVARNIIDSSDEIKHVVVAGCDVLSEFIVKGFLSFRSISERPCRPYDESRDGLTLGEACGVILLTTSLQYAEEPCIELCGSSVSNDANHISGPSRTGDGLFYAMSKAMQEARLTSGDIDFVNTHGTATAYNDEMESKAVAWAELSDTPLNSMKGYIGHTLGASGVVETIIAAYELRRNIVYGTLGFHKLGTPCKVDISPLHRTGLELNNCVKTASGFGGCNAAIVLCKGKNHDIEPSEKTRVSEVAAEYSLPSSSLPFAEFIRSEFKELGQSYMKFYKMSDLSKALYVAVERLLEKFPGFVDIDNTRKAIIISNRASSLEADAMHQEIVNRHNEEGASPAVFVYTLPNVATGEICIKHKIQGDNTFFIENEDSGFAEDYARNLVEYDYADAVICGWCDKLGEEWKVELKIIIFKQ